jgi:hypothetical protein
MLPAWGVATLTVPTSLPLIRRATFPALLVSTSSFHWLTGREKWFFVSSGSRTSAPPLGRMLPVLGLWSCTCTAVGQSLSSPLVYTRMPLFPFSSLGYFHSRPSWMSV